MSKAAAIKHINNAGSITEPVKVALRNMLDVVYADLDAGADPETLAAALISADPGNDLALGADDLLYVSIP